MRNAISRILLVTLFCLFPVSVWAESDSSETRWSFAVEGKPVVQGSVSSQIAAGRSTRYAFASDDAIISASIYGAGKPIKLVIKYKESDTRCTSSGQTLTETVGDKAIVSGKVMCRAADAPPTQPQESDYFAIDGWFNLQD